MTTNAAIGKIKASRVNNLDATEYVGPEGQIWYDVTTGLLRLGDNVTPGGTIIGGGGGGGNPGGPNRSIQFNNAGTFGGSANLTFNGTTLTVNSIAFTNSLYVGNTLFTRTLTIGTSTSPVVIPLSSNNSLNVETSSGNVVVYTT